MSLRQFLAASVAAVAFSGAAVAADLPSRRVAPVAPYVAPIFTWTGFYAGVNAGYAWGSFTKDPKYVFDNPSGFVGGGQIGYNYQIGQFVVGAETDLQYSGIEGKAQGWTGPVAGLWGAKSEVTYYGTIRGRLGVAFDRALVYATGGFAYGEMKTSVPWIAGMPIGGTLSTTRGGWTLGGGIEYAITNNITAKAEYSYVQLENKKYIDGTKTGVDFNTVRAGVNYKF